jgi:hypothetical protein
MVTRSSRGLFATQDEDVGCPAGRSERMGLSLDVDFDLKNLTSFHTLFLPPDYRDREMADSQSSTIRRLSQHLFHSDRESLSALHLLAIAAMLCCSVALSLVGLQFGQHLSFFNDLSRLCEQNNCLSEPGQPKRQCDPTSWRLMNFCSPANSHHGTGSSIQV